MSNSTESINNINPDDILGTTKGSSLEVNFTGNALQDIKNLKKSLGLPDEKSVVNYAIALLIKAKNEKSSIAIINSNNNITYSMDLSNG